jgi:hypothetical protein
MPHACRGGLLPRQWRSCHISPRSVVLRGLIRLYADRSLDARLLARSTWSADFPGHFHGITRDHAIRDYFRVYFRVYFRLLIQHLAPTSHKLADDSAPSAQPSDYGRQQPAGDPLLLAEFRTLQEQMKDVVRDLSALTFTVNRQQDRIRELEQESNVHGARGLSNIFERTQALERGHDSTKADLGRIQLTLYDPIRELNLLKEQVDVLRDSSKVGTGVERHGVTFSHRVEIATLLTTVGGSIAIFHDAVSLLHSIGATTASHKSTLSAMKAQRDVKISTDLDARVITSFRTNLPAILYDGSASVEVIDEYISLISRLKNYAMWHHEDGVSGPSQRILRGAIEIQARVSFLAGQLTNDLTILRLSNGLLTDTVNFIQLMISFIDATYIEYKVMSYLSDTQLWELLVTFLEQIFEDLRAARCQIQDASEHEPSLLLWDIMKSHEVMAEYLRLDFKKHPSLNGILVQKILKSSPSSGFQMKIQALEKTTNTMNGSILGMQTRLASVKTKTAKL